MRGRRLKQQDPRPTRRDLVARALLLTLMPGPAAGLKSEPAPTPAAEPKPPTRVAEPPSGASSRQAIEQADGEPIVEIDVVGNRRVERDVILGAHTQTVDRRFDARRVADDVRGVFALGQFSDVRVAVEQVPEGVRYIVCVEELPVLRAVRIEGERALSEDDLLAELDVKVGGPVSAAAAQRSARRMERLYLERGYALTKVEIRSERVGPDEVDLAVTIQERPRVHISQLRFQGVSSDREKELRGAIALRELTLFTRITGSSVYTPQRIEEAVQAIENFLFDRGRLEARVESAVTLTDEDRRATVTFNIHEGPTFLLDELSFQGESPVPPERLRELVGVKTGQPLSLGALREGLQQVTAELQNQGFACASAIPNIDPDAASSTVDVTVLVQRGERARLAGFEITGNERTRPYVIERELTVRKGDWFTAEGVGLSVERLGRLGLFRSVQVGLSDCEGGEVSLRLKIEEAQTLQYRFSLGIARVERLVGTIELAERNLFGTGRAVSFQGQLSAIRRATSVYYLEPYLFGSNLDAVLDLAWSRFEYEDFQREFLGGGARLRYPLERALLRLAPLSAEVRYAYQDLGITDAPVGLEDPQVVALYRSGRISSVSVGVSYQGTRLQLLNLNDRILTLSAELAPPLLGSTLTFGRLNASARWAFPIPLSLLLRARLEAASISAIGEEPVPVSERFFLGGFGTLRGYRFRSLSPTLRVPDSDGGEQDLAIGGTSYVLGGLELEIPVFPRASVNLVFFGDAGNVFQDEIPGATTPELPWNLYFSAGTGVRWYSPLGVIRLELAFPLTRRAAEPPVVFEFGAGVLP